MRSFEGVINGDIFKLDKLVQIDYSEGTASIYRKAAQYMVQIENSIGVLCFRQGPTEIPNLPSWVPDWNVQRLFPLNRLLNFTEE
jgi:hypothetical protein